MTFFINAKKYLTLFLFVATSWRTWTNENNTPF